jgi:hypothetical protein
VTHDRVERPNPLHQRRIDHFGTRAVFGFGREHEALVVGVTLMFAVIVVIDPYRKPGAEPLDERQRHAFETTVAPADTRESDIEHPHLPGERGRLR